MEIATRGRALRTISDRAGATAIEFAILAPLLLSLILGIVELGRMLWIENALQYAVSEAARCMTIDTTVCGTARETQDFASTSSGVTFPSTVFAAGPAFCGNKVSASYDFRFIAPILPHPVILTAQSCYPA